MGARAGAVSERRDGEGSGRGRPYGRAVEPREPVPQSSRSTGLQRGAHGARSHGPVEEHGTAERSARGARPGAVSERGGGDGATETESAGVPSTVELEARSPGSLSNKACREERRGARTGAVSERWGGEGGEGAVRRGRVRRSGARPVVPSAVELEWPSRGR